MVLNLCLWTFTTLSTQHNNRVSDNLDIYLHLHQNPIKSHTYLRDNHSIIAERPAKQGWSHRGSNRPKTKRSFCHPKLVQKHFDLWLMIPRAHHVEIDFGKTDPDEKASSPVVIAIFDTGVDPNAAGLQVTASGLPKILDIIDCSGAGDIRMTPTDVDVESGLVVGKTGRSLRIPSQWLSIVCSSENNSKVRVGLVEAYSLFPKPLIKKHRKARHKIFLQRNRSVEQELHSQLLRYQGEKNNEMSKDFEVRLKELSTLDDSFSSLDVGPFYDVIMFKGEDDRWRIALDTSENGDLSTTKFMCEYRFKREFSTFGSELLSYSFNVYDDGDVLSVVTVAGSHGTHVAGICAACFPEQPQLNGINPNAQIVSIKIGDTRLGSMETTSALMRGFVAAVEAKVDIINMSYGEPTSIPNQGRICELLRDVVNKHNIVFVGSAGNAGPALGTVGAPAGTTDAAISVGAFVSSEMAEKLYSLRENIPPQQTTWSSRGPSIDGGRGVTVSAPGAAIAPVPTWTLNNKQLMNGTSMSSPNAAGAISNLLAFARHHNVAYSVARIRRAIENTAVPMEDLDAHTIGYGLLNSQGAAEYLLLHRNDPRHDVRFEIIVGKNSQGIYLREPHQIDRKSIHSIKVVPHLADDNDNDAKSKFEINLSLECTASWVTCPSSLFLHTEGRVFSVSVNPTNLLTNEVHYTEIEGVIDDSISGGRVVMFRIPVTVIVPMPQNNLSYLEFNELLFEPGTILRHFLAVPAGAVSAHITISSHGNDDARQFVLHTLYNENWRSHKHTSLRKYITLQGTSKHEVVIPVKKQTTLEVSLSQFWSTLGETRASFRIEWCGLSLMPPVLHFSFVDRITRAEVISFMKTEKTKPNANFTIWSLPLNPVSEGTIRGLSSRDTLLEEKPSYELILMYNFSQVSSCSVTIKCPLLNSLLYESDFDSQMCQIFDSNKKMVHISDAFPKSVTLDKGEYTIRIQIKHDDRSSLMKLQTMPIDVSRKLPKPIDLEIHQDFTSALFHKKTKNTDFEVLNIHESSTYFFTLPSSASMPKGFTSSCCLIGHVTLANKEQKGESVTYPVICHGYLDPIKDKSNGSDEKADEEKTPQTALRDCLVNWISDKSQAYVDKYCNLGLDILLKENPRHIPGLLIQLKGYTTKAEQSSDPIEQDKLNKQAIELASFIIDEININALAASCGVRPPSENKSQTKNIKERKRSLIVALTCKAKCLLNSKKEDRVHFKETMDLLYQWTDIKDSDGGKEMLLLNLWYYKLQNRLGNAVQLFNENETAFSRDKDLHELRRQILQELQWDHWIPIFDNRYLQANPADYALF